MPESQSYDQLSGLDAHEVQDAVSGGRAVEDRRLAAIAADRARTTAVATARTVTALLAITALIGAVTSIAGSDAARFTFLLGAAAIWLLTGSFAGHVYGRAVRAEKANRSLQLGEPIRTLPLSTVERVAAVFLGLYTGIFAAWPVGLLVLAFARGSGTSSDDVGWLAYVPSSVAFVGASLATYRAVLAGARG